MRLSTARDPSAFLRLDTIGARLVGIGIVGTQVIFAGFSLSQVMHPWLSIVALVLFAGAAFLMGQPRPGPFPLVWTATVLAAGVLVNVLVETTLPPGGGTGYASWNFGAVAWLCFFLAFRGRIGAAWIGLLLMAVVTLAWLLAVGRPPLDILDLVARHAGTVMIATLFRVLLDRARARIEVLQRERLAQVADEAASRTELRERDSQAAQLEAEARPVLESIAAGQYLTPECRQDFALLEASLRDALRGRELVTHDIAAAARAARERGGEVVLLDDRGVPLSPADRMQVERAVLAELGTLGKDRLTVRLLPIGRDECATLVRDGAGNRRRIDFATTAAPPS